MVFARNTLGLGVDTMDCEEIFSKIEELDEEYLNLFEKVCNIESPTNHKAGVDAVGRCFTELAKKQNWDIEVMEHDTAGNAICITMNPNSPLPPVTFSGHIDTVHPIGLFGTPAVRRDGEKIYGPGVMDCKGGVVASFMAMDALSQCGFTARPVKLIIQSDEETGSRTSGKETIKFMCEKAKGSVAFLNTEGIQGNTAILIRKGILQYRFTVKGKALHSARCAEASSAILEAAHKIIKLEKMKDPEGNTCNCGIISGGTVANTVPEVCTFVSDIRFADAEGYREAQKAVEEIANTTEVEGCSCTIEVINERPAMPLTERNQELLSRMNEIYEKVGLPTLSIRKTPSGSDAAYITEAGIPCVDNIGVDGSGIHSVNEFAYLDSLKAAAKRLAAVAYCI